MTAVARLLERNSERLPGDGGLLWLNVPTDISLDAGVTERSGFFFQDYAEFRKAGGPSPNRWFGAFPDQNTFDHAVLSLPKSKSRLEMMLDCLAAALSADRVLWLAGENRAGIRSAASRLENVFENVTVLDKARHCILYEASLPKTEQAFDSQNCRHSWTLEWNGRASTIHSWPGVFAHGRLDEGTELLLDQEQRLNCKGRVLDMACGSGVIGAVIKQGSPDIQLVSTDSDALALLSTRATLSVNGLDAEVVASDGFSDIEGLFELVVSNPPFHSGFDTRREHGMNMLAPVRNFLAPGGQLLVVVNRHLPYRKWLDQVFGKHEVLAENTRYQVLQACMPGH